MSNFCKCSSKFYKIPHILRHFICGFRIRNVAPVDKIYGSHFGSCSLQLFIYTERVFNYRSTSIYIVTTIEQCATKFNTTFSKITLNAIVLCMYVWY